MFLARRFLNIALPLALFFAILICSNIFQYYRLKSNVAATIISDINASELDRIRNFFLDTEKRLKLVQQWGQNGVIDLEDTVELNRKFFPFLEKNDQYQGLVLANSQGSEYFLSRKDDVFFTKRFSVGSENTLMEHQQWKGPDKVIVEDLVEAGDYDPRSMAWFSTTGDGENVRWTSMYTFYHNKSDGISGSVHWSPEGSTDFYVFGIDVSLAAIEHLLLRDMDKTPAVLFLTNGNHDFLATDNHSAFSPDFHTLLKEATSRWRTTDPSLESFIRFEHNSARWLASMRRIDKDSDRLWVGILAREKDLMASLQKELFKVDFVDIVFGLFGGFLVLLILRRSGHLVTDSEKDAPRDPVAEVRQLLEHGEGDSVEFKSTVRMNLKAKKVGKEIEFAWLKAVVAFLNSKGGHLLIGVADDGKILGLEADNFENEDRCQLHIKNLINQHIGGEFTNFIRIRLLTVGKKQLLHIRCSPSPDPVFLKIGKNEDFLIRSGPSNTKLSASQTVKYVQSRDNS